MALEIKHKSELKKFFLETERFTQGATTSYLTYLRNAAEDAGVKEVSPGFFYPEKRIINILNTKKIEEKRLRDSIAAIKAYNRFLQIHPEYIEQNNTDSFMQLLWQKKEEEAKEQPEREVRMAKWLKSIDGFYKEIRKWLQPFLEQSLLKIHEIDINKSEEYVGDYQTKKLHIHIGNDIVSLTPVGTYIYGSLGRIDMRGPKAEMIIVEPEWGKWEFVQRMPKRETWEVSNESFKTAIEFLIHG